MTWTSADYKNPIWIFGDSYLDVNNEMRWPYWAEKWGFDNFLLSSFPGETTEEAMGDFSRALSKGTPNTVIWTLGMNNKDEGAINPGWLSNTEQMMAKCESKGINVILATIPNTPSHDNSFKNQYVINSGKRYIDFADAVGALDRNTWYDHMLYSDNLHPAEAGARALAMRALLDVPELMN